MTFKPETALILVFTAFSIISIFMPGAGFAYDEEPRTANRSVIGRILYPDYIFDKPAHYEFLPLVSNWDQQHQHPAAEAGQDWDPGQWNSKWTPDIAISKFFQARIFERQYIGDKKNPILELGPAFYKLSDLDQRRTLKLLMDTSGVFRQGHRVVELVDWSSHDLVGSYTPQGMFLN